MNSILPNISPFFLVILIALLGGALGIWEIVQRRRWPGVEAGILRTWIESCDEESVLYAEIEYPSGMTVQTRKIILWKHPRRELLQSALKNYPSGGTLIVHYHPYGGRAIYVDCPYTRHLLKTVIFLAAATIAMATLMMFYNDLLGP